MPFDCNTRIMEITATLPDPIKAQGVAKFIADATVELNRAAVSESDQDLLRGRPQIFLTASVPETPFGALRDCWTNLMNTYLKNIETTAVPQNFFQISQLRSFN